MFCSVLGYLYQGLEIWKIKSLIWMTIYYIGYGYCYVELVKVFNTDPNSEQYDKPEQDLITTLNSTPMAENILKFVACGLVGVSLV